MTVQRPVDRRMVAGSVVRPLVGQRVGIVVGVVSGGRASVFARGSSGIAGRPRLDSDSVFEIGSITKVFTGILLAEMVSRGEVGLDDPVARHLPELRPPRQGGREITLLDLTTHTAGIPNVPRNLMWRALRQPKDPFAGYTREDVFEAVGSTRARRPIGSHVRYSNIGVGLLGHALAAVAGMPYEDLVVDRVCRPLGMESTAVRLTQGMARDRVQAHRGGRPIHDLDTTALPAAGGLHSSSGDMLRFLRANLDPGSMPIAEALEAAQTARRAVRPGRAEVGLGWMVLRRRGRTVHWHNGGTTGSGSCLALDRDAGTGVVLLSNSTHGPSLDASAFRLLAALSPSD